MAKNKQTLDQQIENDPKRSAALVDEAEKGNAGFTLESGNQVQKNYFNLPFEVHYRGPLNVTTYEFKSDVEVERFSDVKVVHMEQGRAWGVTFSCGNNNGPELYCCIAGLHDETAPDWLRFEDEEDINFNYGCDYAISIVGDEIRFTEEDIDSADEMDFCGLGSFIAYDFDSLEPDYIILDADDSRIKVDVEGYVLDEDGDRVGNERTFNPDDLDEDDFDDYTTCDVWEAKAAWITKLLEAHFPKDRNLRLAFDTE